MADTDSVASSLFPVPKSHLFNGRYDANSWEYKLNDVFQRVKDMGDSIRKDDSLMQLLSQFLDAQAEELGPIPTIDNADVAPVFLKVAYVPRSYSAYVRTIIFGRHGMVHLGENFNYVDKWHWIDDKYLNKRCWPGPSCIYCGSPKWAACPYKGACQHCCWCNEHLARRGDVNGLRELLSARLDPNVTDQWDRTALDVAAPNESPTGTAVIHLLLSYRADCNASDNARHTILGLAAQGDFA